MLILSRKLGQRIVIGDNITITVMAISGDKVHLGIEAPRHIVVNRVEVARRIAAGSAGTQYIDDDGEIEL